MPARHWHRNGPRTASPTQPAASNSRQISAPSGCRITRVQQLPLHLGRDGRLVDGGPLHQPVPEALDQLATGDGAAIVGAKRDRRTLAQVELQRRHVDLLVGADAADDLRCLLGLRAPAREEVGRAQNGLRVGEPQLGTELDDEQVHQQRQQTLHLGGDLRHPSPADLRPSDVLRRVDIGIGALTEREVTSREPHLVVRARAAGSARRRIGDTTFVPAVRLQQAVAEVTDGHLRDVVDDVRLQRRKRDLGQQATASLDLADDGERVPERLAQAVPQQHTRLRHRRQPHATQQRRVGVERPTTAFGESGGPCGECGYPHQRPRRLVAAIGQEAAVHAPATHVVRRQIGMIAQQFVGRVHQRAHVASVRRRRRGRGRTITGGLGGTAR